MNKNLETAKEIIRAYWHKVASDAEYGRSGMSYNDVVATLLYLDDNIEQHIKAVASIMRKALKELEKEKNGPRQHEKNHPKSIRESEEE